MEKLKKSKEIRSKHVAVIKAPPPLSYIAIYSDGNHITEITFRKRINSPAKVPPILREATQQMKEYLEGKRTEFDLPLGAEGTQFQETVWKKLRTVPFGKLSSYQDLAKSVGRPKAARAVGNAVGRNPLPIVIPCHRVVATTGIGGFSSGLPIKKWLLKREGLEDLFS